MCRLKKRYFLHFKEYVSGEGFYYLGRSYRLKLVDGMKGQPPLRLYHSRFELQQKAQPQGREEFIRWDCDSEALLRWRSLSVRRSADRLRFILDAQIVALVKRVGTSPRFAYVSAG